jgi:hypothetical protein
MREKTLKKLGFEKVKVSAEESGDTPFYYYAYRINDDGSGFITLSNDEVKGKRKWKVELLDTGLFIKRSKDLKRIFKIFKLKNKSK